MTGRYEVQLQIARQEDGLWRVEVPGLSGCWVDAATLAQAIADIQEGVAMALDEYEERGWGLPSGVTRLDTEPQRATLPIVKGEHSFARPKPANQRAH